jgi:hypothetical protein
MGSVKKLLEEQIPGVYVISLMIGINSINFFAKVITVDWKLYRR